MQSPCELCPRRCGADRAKGEKGFCALGTDARVASAGPHFGEEPCLVGTGGSGAIFLAGCNLGCVFCQNEDLRQPEAGRAFDTAALVQQMLALEAAGCENVNFVTPTPVAPALMEAITEARKAGLTIPIVWNSSGYERVEVLRLLEGLVDIYMPDFKFSLSRTAGRYCRAPDYPARASASLLEMHRQVGDLSVTGGVARRGLLVRHLVMPGAADEGREIMDFVASALPQTSVNVMGQYRPNGWLSHPPGSRDFAAIGHAPAAEEVAVVRDHARHLGLRLLDA